MQVSADSVWFAGSWRSPAGIKRRQARQRERNRSLTSEQLEAARERSRKWHLENDERQRAHARRHHLSRRFGITPEDYAVMLIAQDGKCAICATTDTSPWRWFCVDHNHTTGEIRGLLCHSCNTAIGQVGDDPKLLRLALAYLERVR